MGEISSQHDERGQVSRRQVLKGVGMAGVAAAAVAVGVAPTAVIASEPSPSSAPFVPRGSLTTRPNFLVVIVDEQRSPPSYESGELTSWRAANLPAQSMLRSNGLELRDHHIMASACAPSRTSFLTGQYPSLHGVTQTSGIAKSAIEGDLYWLDPTTVPTMGDWFRAGGYDTYYKGKWHVSDADLYEPGTHTPYPSYDTTTGERDLSKEQIYLDAGMLEPFGFTGWVGPEPHGSNPNNSASSGPGGSGRDEVYSAQGATQLQELRTSPNPWLLVTSFVNPHDIVLWGELSLAQGNLYLQQQLAGSNVPQELFEASAYARTVSDDLSAKPDAQASYLGTYPVALQPTLNTSDYRRFYYQLQKNVDAQIKTVIDTLAADATSYRDTIVVYFSDHGEMLGAHGGQHQKWHVAYDEVIKVPFIFHNPVLFPSASQVDVPTSHADLLPTMLGLAGLDPSTLKAQLSSRFSQAEDLPGRDLSDHVLGLTPWLAIANQPQYFMTDDEPMRGQQQVGWNGSMYPSVVQPCHLETVIAYLPTGVGGAIERWKYTRYFDNLDFWSTPNSRDVVTLVNGNTMLPGAKTAITTSKQNALADQLEIYNTTIDPLELDNIAANGTLMEDPRISGIIQQLAGLLVQQRSAKRLEPTTSTATGSGLFRFGSGSESGSESGSGSGAGAGTDAQSVAAAGAPAVLVTPAFTG